MNERYAAMPLDEEHSFFGVWDHEEESWVGPSGKSVSGEMDDPLYIMSGERAEAEARRLNENICALCGDQCGEAHANVRVGRVCERCADHRLDESGEVMNDPPLALHDALKIILDFLAPRVVSVHTAYQDAPKLDDAVAVVEEFEERLRRLDDARARRAFPPQDVSAYAENAEAVGAIGFTIAEVLFHAPEGRCVVTYCCPDCGCAVDHCACDGPPKQFVIPAADVDFGGKEPTVVAPGFGPLQV
jgi:hypothetical protein